MSKPNQTVKENFKILHKLTYEAKDLLTTTVVLEPKSNNVNWLIKTEVLEHNIVPNEISLIIEQKLTEHKYGIKLRCSKFIKQPYFRFDSDGPAHRNKSGELSEQQVSTPHFNTFDSEGEEFAFKSKVLLRDEDSAAIANDINFGISHFFQETNITTIGAEEYPEIMTKSPELFENEVDTDPLSGIDFLD